MYTKEDIKRDLKNAGIKSDDKVLMHSSLKSIGQLLDGANTILDALCEYLCDGMIVLPGHTWRDINAQNPHFDVRKSEVCVGALPEIFRKRDNVYRSLHPTHSLLAYGKGASEFVKGDEKCYTPCSPKSGYGRLCELGGKLIMVGVNFSCCTMLHCVEEVARVPGKLTQEYESLYVRDENENEIFVPSFRHHNSNSNYFVKLEEVMRYKNQLNTYRLGDADMLVCTLNDLFLTGVQMLDKDIFLFNDNKPVPDEFYK